MSKRTDLAFESAQQILTTASISGLAQYQRNYENADIKVTEISVDDQKASEMIGKPIGKYVTIENTNGCFSLYSDLFEEQIDVLCKELNSLMGKTPRKIMFAGLGNRAITPDSLGPITAEKIFATRHIKRLAKDIDTSDLSDVSVITTGVMAQTGVESSETVKALAGIIKPDVIIIVDALACSDLSHLGTTIQLTNTGISPGSGVENARKELSFHTLGVPCIAIGVPTVADMNSIAEELCNIQAPEEFDGMLVTPKSIDNLVLRSAGLIATAINRTFHPELSDEEIASLIS
ncbi:MAG: GPR endopeptidase [Ruminococcus sp.]|nr:GPR endopeptidase [Ruminococcus sp.]